MKIERFFSNKNICSRKEFKRFIKNNTVLVNDQEIKSSIYLQENDEIVINQKKYKYNEYVYYVMNKPEGYVCANKDEINKTVFELLSEKDYQNDLFTVGRLDKDTTGLLLITNDGKFAHTISNDKKNYSKTYSVYLEKKINEQDIKKLEIGVEILNGYITKPALVEVKNPTHIYLTIFEGKYHQVKEMLKKVDNKVIKLDRIAIGNYQLDKTLKNGKYKIVNKSEIIGKG